MLDVEAQTEKGGEDGIHLTCKQVECRIPHCLVDTGPELARRLREIVEVEMLDEMNKDNASDGDAPQHVGYVNSRVRQCRWLISVHGMQDY